MNEADELADLMAFLGVAEERSFTAQRRSSAPRNPHSVTPSAASKHGSG
jgi:hypothetical protein